MKNTLVFIHGLESTARGTKGRFFSENFPGMIVEDFEGDFAARMNKLRAILETKSNLIIVGSSYGGLMAVRYAIENEAKIIKLILLAPALNLFELDMQSHTKIGKPVLIYHGTKDEVVDPHRVKDIASGIFTDLRHFFVDDDHPLHKTFASLDWNKLLRSDE